MMCKKKAINFKTHTSLLPLWPARMFPFPDKSTMGKQANVMRTLHVYWIQHKPLSMIMDLLVANMIANDKNDSWNKQTIIIYQAYFIKALNIIYKKIFSSLVETFTL